MASITTATLADTTPPFMTSSTSSLSSAWNQPPNVARIYKQAFQLFITRRTQEAWDALQPIVLPPHLYNPANAQNTAKEDQAPVAVASKNARVKVWNLYVSILNAILELGNVEGKQEFGASMWTKLASNVRQGEVWQDVVQYGYCGQEGNVDPEVVASLATLTIAHAPTQKVTQQRLETYLSIISSAPLDPASTDEHTAHTNSSTTLKDLNTRLRIIEIFTLYVLPRNQEWDYAREFIKMSEILDDERKEGFLQTLQALQDEPQLEQQRKQEREQELQRQRDEELAQAQREADQQREDEAKAKAAEAQRRRQEAANARQPPQHTASTAPESSKQSSNPKANGATKKQHPPPPSVEDERDPRKKPPQQSLSPPKKPRSPPPSLYRRTSMLLQGIRRSILGMGQSVSRHPMMLLRTIFFIFALVMALARRDVRDRLEQARDAAWGKVKRTVGMGVKVSYI